MKTVAVLDDDQSLVELYQTFLGEEGYSVKSVDFSPNLAILLSNLKTTNPDMLILDVHLPGVGSFEIMQGMRGNEGLATLPVLVCSASRPSLSALQAMMIEAGATIPPILEKPFDLDDLAAIVRKLID